MHKYTLPAWHSNKNKTKNPTTTTTTSNFNKTQLRIRLAADECECFDRMHAVVYILDGILCEKFRVTAMVVLKSNHLVRVCICYRCSVALNRTPCTAMAWDSFSLILKSRIARIQASARAAVLFIFGSFEGLFLSCTHISFAHVIYPPHVSHSKHARCLPDA